MNFGSLVSETYCRIQFWFNLLSLPLALLSQTLINNDLNWNTAASATQQSDDRVCTH